MNQAIWLVLAVVFAVVEASTAQLVSIWFAGGAVSAMIAGIFTDNWIIQIIVFILASAVLLVCTRSFVKRLTKGKGEKTNTDSLIGQTAIVIEAVDNDAPSGSAKVDGKIWSIRSCDGSGIPEGKRVTIERIEGVKLIVKPL